MLDSFLILSLVTSLIPLYASVFRSLFFPFKYVTYHEAEYCCRMQKPSFATPPCFSLSVELPFCPVCCYFFSSSAPELDFSPCLNDIRCYDKTSSEPIILARRCLSAKFRIHSVPGMGMRVIIHKHCSTARGRSCTIVTRDKRMRHNGALPRWCCVLFSTLTVNPVS